MKDEKECRPIGIDRVSKSLLKSFVNISIDYIIPIISVADECINQDKMLFCITADIGN